MNAKCSVSGPLTIYKAVGSSAAGALRPHHFLSSFLDVTSIYIFLLNKRKATVVTIEASK